MRSRSSAERRARWTRETRAWRSPRSPPSRRFARFAKNSRPSRRGALARARVDAHAARQTGGLRRGDIVVIFGFVVAASRIRRADRVASGGIVFSRRTLRVGPGPSRRRLDPLRIFRVGGRLRRRFRVVVTFVSLLHRNLRLRCLHLRRVLVLVPRRRGRRRRRRRRGVSGGGGVRRRDALPAVALADRVPLRLHLRHELRPRQRRGGASRGASRLGPPYYRYYRSRPRDCLARCETATANRRRRRFFLRRRRRRRTRPRRRRTAPFPPRRRSSSPPPPGARSRYARMSRSSRSPASPPSASPAQAGETASAAGAPSTATAFAAKEEEAIARRPTAPRPRPRPRNPRGRVSRARRNPPRACVGAPRVGRVPGTRRRPRRATPRPRRPRMRRPRATPTPPARLL